MEQRVVTVIGGAGFVGRYVVGLLAAAGYVVRVVSRHPEAAGHLKTAGDVGQVVLMQGDLARPESLAGKLDHSWAVVNLVGVLFEGGRQNFNNLHAQGAEKLAQLAKAAGAERFIQISALGIDRAAANGAQYARSKLLGERAVLAAFPEATILRPSVIFGPEDHFFNQFAAMACFSLALPLIGGGHTKFQPVYVGDVARAVMAALTRADTMGKTYELGGPHVYSFRQLMEYILQLIGKKRALVSLPFGLASVMGGFGEWLPRPPLTRDQVRLLHSDNIVDGASLGFAELGVTPAAVEMVVPDYLARFTHKPADTKVEQ